MTELNLRRLLQVPDGSFFLFGPRGAGKSTWLRASLPDAFFADLLDTRLFLELSRSPGALEAMVGDRPAGSWVVVDEVQKAPALLDEVHRLMESRRWRFALCGSSARKLRRGGANLLGGRAVTRHMGPFSFAELGDAFDLDASLEWGLLPFVRNSPGQAADILSAYLNTYIREEIREEGIVRKLAPFVRFLNVAGQMNGQAFNGLNIARDAAVARSSVDNYFSILEDTLLGQLLPAYRPALKVRERAHPKFYWFDPGVARAAAGLLNEPVDRLWRGFALETLLFHELRTYNEASGKNRFIGYYRAANAAEVDLVIETRKRQGQTSPRVVCVEVKLAEKWNRSWEGAMRNLQATSGIEVAGMYGVYTGSRAYNYDGLEVLPAAQFLKRLHEGGVF